MTARIFNGNEEYFQTPRTSEYWVTRPNTMYCEKNNTPCSQHNHRRVGYVPVKCEGCNGVADGGWGSDDEGVFYPPGCIKCKRITCYFCNSIEDNMMCKKCTGFETIIKNDI